MIYLLSIIALWITWRESNLQALSIILVTILCGWSLLTPYGYTWYIYCSLGEVIIIMGCLGINHKASCLVGKLSGIAIAIHMFTMVSYLTQTYGFFYDNYTFAIKLIETCQLITCILYSETIIKKVNKSWMNKLLI